MTTHLERQQQRRVRIYEIERELEALQSKKRTIEIQIRALEHEKQITEFGLIEMPESKEINGGD